MKYLKTILILLLIVAVGSCDGFLNDPQPEDSVKFQGELESVQQVRNALTGAYNSIQDGQITGAESEVFGAIMGENASYNGSFGTFVDIGTFNMNAGNVDVENLWNDYYDAISQANLIIRDADKVSGQSYDANSVIGQAKFIRGYMYFSAVRFLAGYRCASQTLSYNVCIATGRLLNSKTYVPVRS